MGRREYFDGVSGKWDGWNRADEMIPKLRAGLRELGVGSDERVVDLGCGTGMLLGVLLEHLGAKGEVLGIDFSEKMLEIAREKHPDPRVRLEAAEATTLPIGEASVDRIICFSAWPHFPDPRAVLEEALRVLAEDAALHIWHLAGRVVINEIHRGVGAPISEDLLRPASDLADMALGVGFLVEQQIDDHDRYLVTVRKPSKR